MKLFNWSLKKNCAAEKGNLCGSRREGILKRKMKCGGRNAEAVVSLRVCFLVLGVFFSGVFFSCSVCGEEKTECDVTLVTWNVQTFFDAVKNGCEYDEFKKGGNWSKEKYLERLERLCDCLKKMDADVFVLEEIENEAVIHDVCNGLGGTNWDFTKNWNYSCFAKKEESAIGCAVLSRYELLDLKVHDLDVQTGIGRQPGMRYLMEVKLDCGGKELVLFANHWKSKSGGEAETEIWRDWQESVLAARLVELLLNGGGRLPVVMCGDFNRDVREFVGGGFAKDRPANVLLRFAGFGAEECVEVYSPWFTDNGDLSFDTGTYYYKKNWEYIDQIFCSSGARITEFEPCTDGPWITSGGIPFSYKIYSGQGYSDHLPLKCKVSF